MSRIDYIRSKTEIEGSCLYTHDHGSLCGMCFWKNITLPPESIPECGRCREDSVMVKQLYKANPNTKIEYEPKCFKLCVWWDWFDRERRNKIGCSCTSNTCSCGRLKYIKREHAVVVVKEKEDNNRKKKK